MKRINGMRDRIHQQTIPTLNPIGSAKELRLQWANHIPEDNHTEIGVYVFPLDESMRNRTHILYMPIDLTKWTGDSYTIPVRIVRRTEGTTPRLTVDCPISWRDDMRTPEGFYRWIAGIADGLSGHLRNPAL